MGRNREISSDNIPQGVEGNTGNQDEALIPDDLEVLDGDDSELIIPGDTLEKRAQFMISVFGTAKAEGADAKSVATAGAIGRVAAKGGFALQTGGYDIGVMSSVLKEAQEELKAAGFSDEEIAVRLRAVPLSENYKVKGNPIPVVEGVEVAREESLAKRQSPLLDEADAYVITSASAGTDYERAGAALSESTEGMNENRKAIKPVILADPTLTLGSELVRDHLDSMRGYKRIDKLYSAEHTYILAKDAADEGEYGGEARNAVEDILEYYYLQGLEQSAERDSGLEKLNSRIDQYRIKWLVSDIDRRPQEPEV